VARSPFHDAVNRSQQHRHDLTTFGTLYHYSPQYLSRFSWLPPLLDQHAAKLSKQYADG
jgi:hypothetical protein